MSARMESLADIRQQCTDYGDCWLWAGSVTPNGYPVLTAPHRGVMVRRHVWALIGNTLPSRHGQIIKTTCGERLCCNPSHLALWSRSQLVADTYRTSRNTAAEYGSRLAGRMRQGTKLGGMEAARLIRLDGRRSADVAKDYGISESMVRKIRTGESWRETAPGASVFTWRPAP